MAKSNNDLGFSYRTSKSGTVLIYRSGALVATLRGERALEFVAKLKGADPAEQQQLMARATGNYKRGNERGAALHPRNRKSGD